MYIEGVNGENVMTLGERIGHLDGDFRELALSSWWFDKDTGDWRDGTPADVIEAAEAIFDIADVLDVLGAMARGWY